MYYVYSLRCQNGFYIGCTDNLKDRLTRHQKGRVPATVKRLPVELDFYIAIKDKYRAFALEKHLKTGSGRMFIKKHLSL
ncbi:MAG: GIY-YIG nuclease family protein [Patescibacteria group bacterium]|nr:GIY-YIG nuclease family protein [Patescibacteria group bacterium]